MTEAEFQELVRNLPPRMGQVYGELLERGPLVPKQGFKCTRDAGPSLSRLAAEGLVRRTGRRRGKQMLWKAVRDPGGVEAAAEAYATRPGSHHGLRWRPSSDRSHSVGLRVSEYKRLAEDPEVQA